LATVSKLELKEHLALVMISVLSGIAFLDIFWKARSYFQAYFRDTH